MSNVMKGMIAGLVATLVLTALMVLNTTMNLMPEIHLLVGLPPSELSVDPQHGWTISSSV